MGKSRDKMLAELRKSNAAAKGSPGARGKQEEKDEVNIALAKISLKEDANDDMTAMKAYLENSKIWEAVLYGSLSPAELRRAVYRNPANKEYLPLIFMAIYIFAVRGNKIFDKTDEAISKSANPGLAKGPIMMATALQLNDDRFAARMTAAFPEIVAFAQIMAKKPVTPYVVFQNPANAVYMNFYAQGITQLDNPDAMETYATTFLQLQVGHCAELAKACQECPPPASVSAYCVALFSISTEEARDYAKDIQGVRPDIKAKAKSLTPIWLKKLADPKAARDDDDFTDVIS